MGKEFFKVRMFEGNAKWSESVKRNELIYSRDKDIRNEFMRDYNRIIHCTAYRRLKHKTQVFFATQNDHICTRIEHVNHVASVSYTLAHFLGLNTQLTSAIAIGHDLGHAPFGHTGEDILKETAKDKLGEKFWHEKNSLRFVDKIETLQSPEAKEENLNLTYAVRDGIICHCGEVDDNKIIPRDVVFDLETMEKASQTTPFTWEGCIVKIADKIAFLGRDFEDALELNILSLDDFEQLKMDIKKDIGYDIKSINNTVLMHNFMIDLCESSSPEKGIMFSKKNLEIMKYLKKYSYENIYNHKRLNTFKNYAELIINSIYDTLIDFYDKEKTLSNIDENYNLYPTLLNEYRRWLVKYSNIEDKGVREKKYKNYIIYDIEKENDYISSVLEFISGMTDNYAIRVFNELIRF